MDVINALIKNYETEHIPGLDELPDLCVNQNTADYVEISRQIYEEQALDDFFSRAKQNWQG